MFRTLNKLNLSSIISMFNVFFKVYLILLTRTISIHFVKNITNIAHSKIVIQVSIQC